MANTVPITEKPKIDEIDADTYLLGTQPDEQGKRTLAQVPVNRIREKYRVIADITLTEDINEVVRTVDDNGNALNIRKFFLVFVGNFTPGVAFPMILRFNDGVIYSHYKSITFPETTTKNTFWIKVEKYADGIVRSTYSNGFIGGTTITDGVIKNQGFAQSAIDCASNFFITYPATQNKYTKITKWHFGAHPSSEGQMLAGSRILVMGVRE